MKRTRIAATLLAATALALPVAPATADPLGDLFGSASGSLDSGSAALGSSGDKVTHYGKLGRPGAPNGVKSINVWVYTPNKTAAITPGTYPKNSRLGVRWNSIINSGPIVDGNECRMEVRLSGPKVPKAASLFKTRDCTAVKSYFFKGGGDFTIRVTDTISGASNSINFSVQ
ncbi:hypothetical protein IA539_23085 [Gordonia sp. zg691]|uniref:Uncharacterized protein n=1 Tax=Gordonia jinghuaiqii TaxID=2758710 RepID=A0A7D7LZH8_9ACTN|nr:hypothetical protein [Gordonia jinghuaiqii]MBD0864056.1 hypothetical protein [Gordonia jinghuaiqii]MCR5977963.1 hypothetical protein [Gordonia jinghuaiqii]QMT02614.1 hypothetical protein H1R19_05570 [Gordonia jinghuaiqii]